MQKEQLRKLLQRYAAGNCTPQEEKFLEDMMLNDPIFSHLDWSNEAEKELLLIKAKQEIDRKIRPKKNFRLWYLSAAASLLLIVGISRLIWGGHLLHTKPPVQISGVSIQAPKGITLTLADGSVLDQGSLKEGTVKQVAGLVIRKLANGEMSYEYARRQGQSCSTQTSAANNTIHIPNGTKVQLTLTDGTLVWLNTGSKLTYPTVFSGPERKVTLDGEAYFEVAHNRKMPFIVLANGAEILVTGTHFNVSAYHADQTIRTTLLEGGVAVKNKGKEVLLTPGFEAVANANGSALLKQKGNLEQVMAWKNGYFVFDDMDIIAVMRSVARWYDITVKVEGKIPVKIIGGTFPVTADLDELLKDLGKIANIKFKRNGKEVIIK